MDILVLQIFNSLFYASVLFLIAAGLSLIFGVMRIVNMAHGTFYASAPSSRRGWSGAQLRSVCPPDGCFS